ncbi:MAG: 23S rRNA (uracil(1939)-C(5))-methyltransferase RlmD [Clostridiales bacterium]|nr:23S rRNA (uracil(1939)-C(5))-methyltransferase RlmD [Clostridiales bacterium]
MSHSVTSFVCTIESLGFSGEGICRHEGQVVFVPHALPGETVEIQIIKQRKQFAFAMVLQLIHPSKERVQPICSHFYRCGGCAAQHMTYETQLLFKQLGIQENLRRIANTALQAKPVIGMDIPLNYRNKTTWKVALIKDTAFAGFFAPGSHELVPVDTCYIASESSNQTKNAVVRWLNHCLKTGILQNTLPIDQFTTRTNQSGELVLILQLTSSELPLADELIHQLQQSVQKLLCVCTVNDCKRVQVLYGQPLLKESVLGVSFQLSPFSFFQVNYKVCEQMYAYAIKQAVTDHNDVLIDLYSGIGTIGLIAAGSCKKVIGIERNEGAVLDARQNAAMNQISNAVFHAGEAEAILPRLVAGGLHADAVILDPPRKGAHRKVLEAIVQTQPQRIVYISCHPASQARDAAVLAEMGYPAVASQPFDMFCQTAEVENVMTFVKKSVD